MFGNALDKVAFALLFVILMMTALSGTGSLVPL